MDDFKQTRQQTYRPASVDGFTRSPVALPRHSYLDVSPPAGRAAAPVHQSKPKPPRRPLPKLDMSLPGAEPLGYKMPVVRRGFSLIGHWAFKTAIAMLVLLIGGGALLFAQGVFSTQKVFRGGAKAAALQANVDPNLLKGEGEGRINVLLLGIGGPGHDGSDLTDTMIVASIDPVNGKAVLLSVPRDLWVQVPKHGSMKINAAYAMGKYDVLGKMSSSNDNITAIRGGFALADETVESVLGIDIHYNVLVNFQAFRQAVDTLGGVTVNVPSDLYDPTMAWENGGNPVLAKAGLQTFDGKQALLYVRSRETSSDFARSERQRTVIMAIANKIATAGTISNPLKLSQLMSAFGNNVVTDLSLGDASHLYDITKKIDDSDVTSLDFVTPGHQLITTGRVGNQSVDLPLAGMYNYNAMQVFVRSALPDGYITKEHANITVLNGSSNLGLAQTEAADLRTYGYNIGTVGNAPNSFYPKTELFDLSGGKDKYTLHYLQQRFGITASTKLPAGSSLQKGTAAFILVLGNDEAASR